jgi:ABC-type transport system involved in multi-copper enzyme maturation permease subunit
MITSFKAEFRKLRQRPAVWILGGILLAALVFFGYAFDWVQLTFPSKNFHNELGLTPAQLKAALYPINFVKQSLEGVGILGGALALILGALAVGSEFGWGTVKTVYTQRPGRLQALAGQVGVMAVITATYSIAFFAIAALCSWIIATIDGHPATWPAAIDIVKAALASWLIFGCWAAFGMALAYLFRQSAMAIGIGLAYLLAIEGLLFRVLNGFDASWVHTVEKFFAGQNATALLQSFGQVFARPGTAAPLVTAGEAVIALAAYTVVFGAVSALLVRARDVA